MTTFLQARLRAPRRPSGSSRAEQNFWCGPVTSMSSRHRAQRCSSRCCSRIRLARDWQGDEQNRWSELRRGNGRPQIAHSGQARPGSTFVSQPFGWRMPTSRRARATRRRAFSSAAFQRQPERQRRWRSQCLRGPSRSHGTCSGAARSTSAICWIVGMPATSSPHPVGHQQALHGVAGLEALEAVAGEDAAAMLE
jgi:hypothetical protein